MKKFLFLLLSLMPMFSFAQVQITTNEFPRFEGVVEELNLDSQAIYAKLKSWINENYSSANEVLQLHNNGNMTLIIKDMEPFTYKVLGLNVGGQYYYRLTLEAMKGSFRFNIEASDVIVADGESAFGELIINPNKFISKSIAEKINLINSNLLDKLTKLANNNLSNDY